MEQQELNFCELPYDNFLQILLHLNVSDAYSLMKVSRKMLEYTREAKLVYLDSVLKKFHGEETVSSVQLIIKHETFTNQSLHMLIQACANDLGYKTIFFVRDVFCGLVSIEYIVLESRHTRAFHYELFDFICVESKFNSDRRRALLDALITLDDVKESISAKEFTTYDAEDGACKAMSTMQYTSSELFKTRDLLLDNVVTESEYRHMILIFFSRVIENFKELNVTKVFTALRRTILYRGFGLCGEEIREHAFKKTKGVYYNLKRALAYYLEVCANDKNATVENLFITLDSYRQFLTEFSKKTVDDKFISGGTDHEYSAKKSKVVKTSYCYDFLSELSNALVAVSLNDKKFMDCENSAVSLAKYIYEEISIAARLRHKDYTSFPGDKKLIAFVLRFILPKMRGLYTNKLYDSLFDSSVITKILVTYVLNRYTCYNTSVRKEMKELMEKTTIIGHSLSSRQVASKEQCTEFFALANRIADLIYKFD